MEQRDDPLLRGKPAAVCGSLSRSVVTSATYEARPYGIRAGMSTQEAKRRCPQLILVKGDHSKYTATAARIFSILKGYTPLVEVASIDEAYLDITQSLLLFQSPLQIAQSIKDQIRESEQLTCSIGVSPNKLLAKLGSVSAQNTVDERRSTVARCAGIASGSARRDALGRGLWNSSFST